MQLHNIINGLLSVLRLGVLPPPEAKQASIEVNFLLVEQDIEKAFDKLKDDYERNQKILRQ